MSGILVFVLRDESRLDDPQAFMNSAWHPVTAAQVPQELRTARRAQP